MNPNERDADFETHTKDLEHLRYLSIGYYVLSGLSALCALFPIIHFTIGLAMVMGQFPQPPAGKNGGGPPPEFLGWIFVVAAGLGMLFGWTYSIALFIAGRMINRQRRYTFCLVMAGFACLQQPFGVVLGVFSFILLTRKSVKQLFEENALPPAMPHEEEHDRYERGENWN